MATHLCALDERSRYLRFGYAASDAQIHRYVDMIDFGELRAFMYTDDLSYRQMADRWKGHRPAANTRDLSKPHRSPEQRYNNEYEPFFSLLFSHFWLNDLDFYRAADLFVQPSHFEAFGSSAVEAMASGLPIVSSGVGGLGDFLVDGQNALQEQKRAF